MDKRVDTFATRFLRGFPNRLLLGLLVTWIAPNCSAAVSTSEAENAFRAGQYDVALKRFEQLAKAQQHGQPHVQQQEHQNGPELPYFYARSLYRDRQLTAAEEILVKNVERYPDHANSHFLLGSTRLNRLPEVNLFRKASLAKRALGNWQRAIQLDDKHIEGHYAVASFLLNAPGIVGGDEEAGQAALVKLKVVSDPYAQLVRAGLARRKKEFADAEQMLKEAIPMIPDRAFPLLILADLYIDIEDYEAALSTLKQYQSRPHAWNDPGEAQIALLMGQAYVGLKRRQEAEQAFQLAIRTNPPPAVARAAKEALQKL